MIQATNASKAVGNLTPNMRIAGIPGGIFIPSGKRCALRNANAPASFSRKKTKLRVNMYYASAQASIRDTNNVCHAASIRVILAGCDTSNEAMKSNSLPRLAASRTRQQPTDRVHLSAYLRKNKLASEVKH